MLVKVEVEVDVDVDVEIELVLPVNGGFTVVLAGCDHG